jgi:putative transposase
VRNSASIRGIIMAGQALPYEMSSFMPNFRRNWVPGGTLFFTVVAAGRAPLFGDASARSLLGACLRFERDSRPFAIDSIVLLPDHLHVLWTLPTGDSDFSTRLSAIKARFTREWLASGGIEHGVPPGQKAQGRRGVWQARSIEHTIRDDDDLIRHVEYIHFNPVKHGHVACSHDWPWSSFRRYVRLGDYPIDWACSQGAPMPRFDAIDVDLIE